jgi:hypothetical protein
VTVANCPTDGGEFVVEGKAQLEFSPPAAGPYSGVLLFSSRDNYKRVYFAGGSGTKLTSGVIYAPNPFATITLGAGGGELRLGVIVGANLLVTGNGDVAVSGIG